MAPKETNCTSCDGEGQVYEGDVLIQCPDCGGSGFIDLDAEDSGEEEE